MPRLGFTATTLFLSVRNILIKYYSRVQNIRTFRDIVVLTTWYLVPGSFWLSWVAK